VLAAAALALPGIALQARAEERDGLDVQYGRYQEGERDLQGVESAYSPIEVDNLSALGRLTLSDRVTLQIEYVQDTWSGASPITTAPRVLGGNRPTGLDGVSGATPYVQGDLFLDSQLRPLALDALGSILGVDSQLVHTLSSASPETRRQGSFRLGHDWDDTGAELGAGVSVEDDYRSIFGNLGGRLDLDQKQTTLRLGVGLAHSETQAMLDHDAVPYIDVSAFESQIESSPSTGDRELHDARTDFSLDLGATRILSRNSVVEASVSLTRSRGYLGNPYKVVEVGFIDPAEQFLAPPGGYYARVRALLERRPDERDQLGVSARFSQYVESFDASLNLGYRFFADDWGIHAHTLEASWAQPLGSGWLVVPRVRFYSQDSADFYMPYLLSSQAFQTIVTDPDTGDVVSITPFDHSLLPSAYSSDARLSGFGALGAGLTVRKILARGITLEVDLEYYEHSGRLKLGGGSEGDYADYDSLLISASLRLDSSALHALRYRRRTSPSRPHSGHAALAPAGILFEHMLDRKGQMMLGYRYMFARQSGSILRGSRSASDPEVIAAGCEGASCSTVPERMHMHMHMLEFMYAPTDWLSLMLMPQLVDMNMDLRPLKGAVPDIHGSHGHSTGGPGDTLAAALFRLLDRGGHRVHAGLGLSAPTGDVDLKLRRTHQESRGLIHYAMQLGSGTWDLLPTLTYSAQRTRWAWGAQLGGALRLQQENKSGYRLGNSYEITAWGGPRLTAWLTLFGRLSYSALGSIHGEYEELHSDSGPMDFPSNYGGRYWDLGFGISAVVPHGYLEGNRLSLEWLQALHDDVRGYQLERRGRLSLSWAVEF
jgi:hypothetical protein